MLQFEQSDTVCPLDLEGYSQVACLAGHAATKYCNMLMSKWSVDRVKYLKDIQSYSYLVVEQQESRQNIFSAALAASFDRLGIS